MEKKSSDLGFKIYWAIALAFMAGYILLSLITPNDPKVLARYNVSEAQINLVRISFIVPFLIYWLSGVISAAILKKYAIKLGNKVEEGKAIYNIGNGLFVLVSGLIFGGLLNSLRSYLLSGGVDSVNLFSQTFQRADVIKFFTITTNYLNVFIPLIAFWFIWKGSRLLAESIKQKYKVPIASFAMATVALLTMLASYATLLFANPYRQVGNPPLIQPAYYISDPMIFATIIIPYAIFWFLGVFALINITFYSDKVQGIVYKKFFSSMSIGFLLVIALSIGLQFLSTIGYTLADESFNVILLLVYAIVFIQALGYVFIARGASKLKLIEDVVKE